MRTPPAALTWTCGGEQRRIRRQVAVGVGWNDFAAGELGWNGAEIQSRTAKLALNSVRLYLLRS